MKNSQLKRFSVVVLSVIIAISMIITTNATIVMTQQTKEDISDATHIKLKYSTNIIENGNIHIAYEDGTSEDNSITQMPYTRTFTKETTHVRIGNTNNTAYSTGQIAIGNTITINLKFNYVTDTRHATDRCVIYFYKNGERVTTQTYNLIEIGQTGQINFSYEIKNSDNEGFYFRWLAYFYGDYISISLNNLTIEEIDSESIGQVQKKTSEDVADIKDKIEEDISTPAPITPTPDTSHDGQIASTKSAFATLLQNMSSTLDWWSNLWSNIDNNELFGTMITIGSVVLLVGAIL